MVQPKLNKTINRCLVYLFVLIVLILPWLNLNQSLWLDEAVVANAVQKYSYLELLTKFSIYDFHPPLYYWLIKFWTSLFGFSEVALRLPSVFLYFGIGYVLYLVAGNWAAAFFLFNPLALYYAQEARPYMLVSFCLTLAVYALKKLSQHKQKYQYLLFGALVCSLLSFYGSVFFIVAILMYLVLKKQYVLFYKLILFLSIVIIVLLPLLAEQWHNAQTTTLLVTNWRSVLGPASLKNLILIPIKFSFGRISFQPKIIYYLLAGIWTSFVWIFLLKYRKENQFYYILLVLPLAFGFIFSFFTPLLQYFRFLYLLPLLAILLSQNVNQLLLKKVLLIGFLTLSLIYLLLPQFHREDWQSLSHALPPKSMVLGIPASLEALKYYQPEIKLRDIRAFKDWPNKPKAIIVIPYTLPIYGFNDLALMQGYGYEKKRQQTFRELELVVWQKME